MLNLKHFLSARPALQSAIPRILAVAVWCAFVARALHVFAPGSRYVDFNSDSAIPVLMSVEEGPITPFNLYYFAQDRWGAWPFLVTQLVRHVTGFHWGPESVFLLHGFWVLSGSLVLAALSRRDAVVLALSYLCALCLHQEARYMLFRLSQPYAWQVTSVLFAWLGLRRNFDSYLTGEPVKARRRVGWGLLAFLATFLACSSSASSPPFVASLLAVELVRGLVSRSRVDARRKLIAPALLGAAAVAGGAAAEHLQRSVFHRYALRHYGRDFATNVALDWDYLGVNLERAWESILKLSWWPIYFVPPLLLAVVLVLFAYARIRRRNDISERLKDLLADDTTTVAAGTYLIAIVNFAIVVVVSHVRHNDYDDRYLTPTNLFAPISGVISVLLLAKLMIRKAPVRRGTELALAGLSALVLTVAFPARGSDERYQEQKDTALELARRAPRAILMGTYWDTYYLSALMPDRALTPLPFEGNTNRLPWAIKRLRATDSVVVAFKRDSDRARTPPVTLRQYDVALTLSNSNFYEESEYVFALYRTTSGDRSPLRRSYGPGDLALARCAKLGADNVIEAENCRDGFVVFGPYISVPGNSDVDFRFELEATEPMRVLIDVTSSAGKVTHAVVPEQPVKLGSPHFGGQIVHVFDPVDKLECRVIVRAEGPVSFKIRNVSLTVR